jgi:alpha-galactosidase
LQPLPVLVRLIFSFLQQSATKLAFVTRANHATAVTANGANFTLTGDDSAYLFHVDEETGELISDHFGGPADDFVNPPRISSQGWVCLHNLRYT